MAGSGDGRVGVWGKGSRVDWPVELAGGCGFPLRGAGRSGWWRDVEFEAEESGLDKA